MSKYYKADDVIRAIEEMQNCYNGWSDTYDKAEIIGVLDELPTIEVSEDAISREWLIKRFKDIVEHYEMRIKRAKRYGKKTTYDTSEQIGYWKDEIADCKYFIKEIENAPSVIQTTEPQTYITEDRDTQILDAWQVRHRNAPSVIPKTDCDTCKWGEWYRNGRDITNMDDECGGCCSWNSKWTPKETETEAERLDRIDNEIEDAYARIRELTADPPQTELKGSKRLVKGSEEEKKSERLDKIDNEIEDAWARSQNL